MIAPDLHKASARRRRPAVALLIAIVGLAAAVCAAQTTPDGDGRPTTTLRPPAADAQAPPLGVGQAIVLGIVEGVTEYLPVSSTGHLLVVQQAMGIGTESESAKRAADAYAICIQAGAILAVLGLYIRRVGQMLRGLVGQDRDGLRLSINIVAAFAPAAVIGLLFDEWIEQHLFGPWPIVAAWLVGGAAILIVDHRRRRHLTPRTGKDLHDLTWKLAVVIGLAQCLAMWPGVSRSLVTIVGGVLIGLSLSAAVEFSFLLGAVTLTAATGYKVMQQAQLPTDEQMWQVYGWDSMFVGFLVAIIAAMFAVKWMVQYLRRHGLSIFGYYRVAIAIIVGLLLALGLL